MLFQQDRDRPVILRSPAFDGNQEPQGIHAFHQRRIRQDQFQFVCLQMTDEMPLDISGHLRHFLRQFLRTAFCKNPLPGIIRLHQAIDGMKFGNCRQANARRQFSFDFQ